MDTEFSLIKKILDADGTQGMMCASHGTSICHIHNGNCTKCPVMQKMLEQLHTYEHAILSSGNKDYIPFTTCDENGIVRFKYGDKYLYPAVVNALYLFEEL